MQRNIVRKCVVCSKYYGSKTFSHKAACSPICELRFTEEKKRKENEEKDKRELKAKADKERVIERKRRREKTKRENRKLKKDPDALLQERNSLLVAMEQMKKENSLLRKQNKRLSNQRPVSISFYDSEAWRKVRFLVLKRDGRICVLCRATKGSMHVDHIIPRSIDRTKELDPDNLQVLCEACNLGKGNKDQTDFRKDQSIQHV